MIVNTAHFRVIIENAFDGITIADDKGKIIYVNNALCKLVKRSEDELISGSRNILFPGGNKLAEALATREKTGKFIGELEIKDVNDHLVPVEVTSYSYINENNQPFFATSFRDISKRKENEIKFRTLFQHGSDMMGLLDEKGTYLYVSSSVERLLGYKPEDMTGRSAFEFIHPGDVEKAAAKLQELFTRQTVLLPGFRFRNAHGKYRWVETRLDNMLEIEGVGAIVGTSRDITERRKAENALKKKKQELARTLDKIDKIFYYSMDMLCTVDKNGRFTEVSSSCREILGYEPEELISHRFDEFILPEDLPKALALASEITKGKPVVRFENRYVHKNGKIVDLLWSAYWTAENGFQICIARDITEQKNATRELEASEQRFRSLFDLHPDAAVAVDCNGIITAINQNFLQILRLNAAEVIGKPILSFFNLSGDQRLAEGIETAAKGKANSFETNLFSYNNRYIKICITIVPIITYGKVTGAYCITKNITENWQDEQRRIAEKTLLENTAAGTDMLAGLNTFIQHIEEIYPHITCSISRIKQDKYFYFYVAPSLSQPHKDILNGIEIEPDIGGSPSACYYNSPVISLDIEAEQDWKKYKEFARKAEIEACVIYPVASFSGKVLGTLTFNYRNKNTFQEEDVQTISQMAKLVALVMDSNLSYEDIKRKNAELLKINTELDRFAYSTSHELRAPLTSILGLINLAKEDKSDIQEVRGYIKMIESSTLKLLNFISKIGNYHNNIKTEVKKSPVHLKPFVEEAIAALRYMDKENDMIFRTDIAPDICIYTDEQRLTILFNNLISNAIKYSDNSKPQKFVKIAAAYENAYVKIVVEDNGTGIAEKHLPKIFNMFYRATDCAAGSGLGLYIVKEITDKLTGKIEIQSKTGTGTCVILKLPVNKDIVK